MTIFLNLLPFSFPPLSSSLSPLHVSLSYFYSLFSFLQTWLFRSLISSPFPFFLSPFLLILIRLVSSTLFLPFTIYFLGLLFTYFVSFTLLSLILSCLFIFLSIFSFSYSLSSPRNSLSTFYLLFLLFSPFLSSFYPFPLSCIPFLLSPHFYLILSLILTVPFSPFISLLPFLCFSSHWVFITPQTLVEERERRGEGGRQTRPKL